MGEGEREKGREKRQEGGDEIMEKWRADERVVMVTLMRAISLNSKAVYLEKMTALVGRENIVKREG